MELLMTSKHCMLCSGATGKEEWTREFDTVFLNNNNIQIGRFTYTKRHVFQNISSWMPDNHHVARLRVNASSSYMATTSYLIHSSCRCLLQKLTKTTLHPDQLFKLCQSLQPDSQRNYGFPKRPNLGDCLDPYLPIVTYNSTRLQNLNLKPNSVSYRSSLLSLMPPDIMLMILEYLSPSSLIDFFCSSKWILSHANLFYRQNPLYFYGCVDTDTKRTIQFEYLILTLFDRYSHSQYRGLDQRWEVVLRVASLVKYIPIILNRKPITGPTLDMGAPLLPVDHSFGYQKVVIEVPDNIKVIRVYTIIIQGYHYVCGIRFTAIERHSSIGRKSSHFNDIDVSDIADIDMIGFIVDSLGIRSLRFGDSSWSSGDPEHLQSWEGISKREGIGRGIRVAQDALKFRQIDWSHTGSSFAERILMRERHPIWRGLVYEEDFQQRPDLEENLVMGYGKFTTEVVWFDDDLRGISIYCDNARSGISGISVHTTTRTYCIGANTRMAKYFPLHGPDEVFTNIEVKTLSAPAITLTTNWDRRFDSAPVSNRSYNIRILQPPPQHHIEGIYFRMGGLYIESFGAIYAPGLRGSVCPSILSAPTIPETNLEYEQITNLFKTCARLSEIKKIWIYHESDHCIGLRLFYRFNFSEVVGRILEGNHYREIVLHGDDTISRIWITIDDEKLTNIDFDIGDAKQSRKSGEPHDTTKSTVIAWWYSLNRDVIRFFY